MRRAFTMVEIIVVIVIMGILSMGTLISIKHLYIRAAKTKTINDFSLNSQIALNQISSLLYDRVPSSTIGYDLNSSNFQSIYDINSSFTVLEWIGIASEAYNKRDYSGFTDMDRSDRDDKIIASFSVKEGDLNTTEYRKFGISYTYSNPNISDKNITALIFTGAFDTGSISSDFNNSFGWHGHGHNITYDIIKIKDNNITLSQRPDEIYEKYYLVDSAYGVARGEDIDINSTCIESLNISDDDIRNTLFLFYNYRPWKRETFCADLVDTNGTREGNVTILSQNVTAFKAGLINDSLYFSLTLSRKIRGSDNNVTISKQKVIF